MVLAAARQARRDRAAVEADRGDRDLAERGQPVASRRQAGVLEHGASACSIALTAASRASSPAAGRATITKSRPVGQSLGARPEGLAQQPLDAVALHRAAELAADRHAEPRRLGVRARERVDDQVAAGVRAPLAVDPVELAAAGQPAALATRAVGHRAYGVSRLRPLPRRRMSTRRPARVLMRHGSRGCGRACASWAGRCASSREGAAVRAGGPRAGQGTRSPGEIPVHTPVDIPAEASRALRREASSGFSRVLRAGARGARRGPPERV